MRGASMHQGARRASAASPLWRIPSPSIAIDVLVLLPAAVRYALEQRWRQEEMEALEKARAKKKTAGRQNGMLACERESTKKRKVEDAEVEAKREDGRKEGAPFAMEEAALLQKERAHRQVRPGMCCKVAVMHRVAPEDDRFLIAPLFVQPREELCAVRADAGFLRAL